MNSVVLRAANSSRVFRSFFALSLLFLAAFARAEDFETIRPLLKEFCLKCHSTEKQKGDLDLEQFSTLTAIKKHPKIWQKVLEQLNDNEMPPAKEKTQPTPAQKMQLMAWVRGTLDAVALERAGDPGPVVLRRLSNAEYTYTIRDLTGVEALDPAREFPADGAAGEGFTNTGNALVMSPSLITKYLDAGKGIADHAVLLPGGIRFSAKTSRRDRTEELLAEIRAFYAGFTDPRGGDKVNLQGIVFETNAGGRLPLEKYFAASLDLRKAASAATPEKIALVARERGLSPKYLQTLMDAMYSKEPSLLLDGLRERWRTNADAPALTAEVAQWQKILFKFSGIGHIGKLNGPKAWLEPVTPITSKQEIKLKLPPPPDGKDITLYLVAGDAGDGNEQDFVVWQQPKLVAPGRQPLLLRDVQNLSRELAARRERLFSSAAKCLTAGAEASAAQGKFDAAELAQKYGVEPDALGAWLEYLGIGGSFKIQTYMTQKNNSGAGFEFIKGWGKDLPSLVANSSDKAVRIPGNMKPHGVCVHPSPTLQACIGWRSPVAANVRVEATVQHAHPECGNGITWSLELRRGATKQRLANGTAQGPKEIKVPPIENLAVQPGDLISMLIGARDGNHSCDLTSIEMIFSTSGEGAKIWNLTADVTPDILAGNPHADKYGNEGVWHFYTEPDKGSSEIGLVIPAGSLLAKWQSAPDAEAKQKLADEVQALLTTGTPAAKDSPDAKLYQQLASLGGPLLAAARSKSPAGDAPPPLKGDKPAAGLDPALFGHHPNGQAIDAASLCVRAPSVIEIHLPADLVAGCEFVTTGVLDKTTGAEGSVQLQAQTTKPEFKPGLVASAVNVVDAKGAWTSNNISVAFGTPIVANDGSATRKRIETAFDDFRRLFPPALCYTKIVPVDEVVTLTLFYREDDQLARLMLDDAQKAKLDRLWDELHYISHDAFTSVDVFEQLWQFATQDADPKVFEPLREPIKQRAAAFKQRLIDTQPKHVDAVLEFANRAYRRPLTDTEKGELRSLYEKLRAQELPHEDAIRMTLARVLVAPAFLYRAEKAGPGTQQAPVSAYELASRLSYFLWSSQPDAELRAAAESGKLLDPKVLTEQTQRMLRDPRVRRMATEFGCAWLHIHGFDELNEKSDRHFPTFVALRGDMYEESIRFFTDFFQNNRPVLNILDSDYTFLNEALAKHYGIPNVKGPEFRRVDGVKKYSRGGILGQAATLAKQSGASRTSPILRGNWVAEALLGDKLPRPPKDVPRLPEDEANETLTVRQLTEKHTDARCAGCHVRIDAFGFALENFDAIGRFREKDMGNRPLDTKAKVLDGTEIQGLDGLRNYVATNRRDAFLRQFCRKLLGYSLGRAVQLSDEPLLKQMQAKLAANEYHIETAIEAIVLSRQFREIRGRDAAFEE